MSLENSFKGKSVLVTGAGSGIGRAISERLHGYGATVYALSRSKETLDSLVKELPTIIPIQLDIGASWSETRKAIDELKNLDVVINNAAVRESPRKPILEFSENDYDRLFDINLKAVTIISQTAAKNMIAANKKGSILNISSIAAIRVVAKTALYGTSKAALDMLTKYMALELGKHSIRVNAIHLGMVLTDGFKIGIQYLEEQKLFARVSYGQDFLPMDEIVNTILFTASDLAPTLTGSCIVHDGGFSLA